MKKKIIVTITTYERFDMLCKLLEMIEKESALFDFHIHIYEDGGEGNYKNKILKKFNSHNITYRTFDKNFGKKNFWRIIKLISFSYNSII